MHVYGKARVWLHRRLLSRREKPVNDEVPVAVSFLQQRAVQGQILDGENGVGDAFAGERLEQIAILRLVEAVGILDAAIPFEHIAISVGDGFEVDINRGAGKQAEVLHLDRGEESISGGMVRIDI